jgi:hypothetical protein
MKTREGTMKIALAGGHRGGAHGDYDRPFGPGSTAP